VKEPELYKPAEACRIAEVAPYVLRYWETEFPALAEGRDKGASRLYTGRDVQVIRRIRELLYDEGFTVAGAKKRLEAEISEGRFEGEGLEAAPPIAQQKKTPRATASAPAPPREIPPTPVVESGETAFLSDIPLQPRATSSPNAVKAASKAAAEFPDKKRVVRELRDIVKILDRAGRKTR
jgi:DNA-binding transcriptional MerR regulator